MITLSIIRPPSNANSYEFKLSPSTLAIRVHRVEPASKRRRTASLLGGLLIAAMTSATSFADATTALVANLNARKVVIVAGKETFSPAAAAKPGELIEYTASYRNQSAKPLGNVQPVLPIPAGSHLIGAGLSPKPTAASTDGVLYSTFPLKRSVTLPDGTQHVVDVPLTEYRALRWDIGTLTPNTTRSVTARVEILSNPPENAAR